MQCPALSAYTGLWPEHVDTSDLLIVWMDRNLTDIQASMKRVAWNNMALNEIYSYEHVFGKMDIKPSVPEMKNTFWNDLQKPKLIEAKVDFIDLWYESLKEHPMWIPKEQRKDFKENQTMQGQI